MTVDELLALLDDFPWEDYNAGLRDDLTVVYRDLVVIGGHQAAAAIGNLAFNADDPFLSRFATKYIGERIVQLSGTTKDGVIETIRQAFAANEGSDIRSLRNAIVEAVAETVEGYEEWRALRIARTESAIALNHGNALGFAQHGIEQVTIRDGTQDPACATANGQVWPLKRWLADPIAHPNCERSASAVLAELEAAGAYERFQAEHDVDDLAGFCALVSEAISIADDPCDRPFDE